MSDIETQCIVMTASKTDDIGWMGTLILWQQRKTLEMFFKIPQKKR
jgi:hypothetical protein